MKISTFDKFLHCWGWKPISSCVFPMILNIFIFLRSWVFPPSPISEDCCVCSKHLFQLNPCLWILHQIRVSTLMITIASIVWPRGREKVEYSCFVFSIILSLSFNFFEAFPQKSFQIKPNSRLISSKCWKDNWVSKQCWNSIWSQKMRHCLKYICYWIKLILILLAGVLALAFLFKLNYYTKNLIAPAPLSPFYKKNALYLLQKKTSKLLWTVPYPNS